MRDLTPISKLGGLKDDEEIYDFIGAPFPSLMGHPF